MSLDPGTRHANAHATTGPATVNQHVQSLIAEANTDFQQAQTDLKSGNFAAYGTDITNLQGVLQQLQTGHGEHGLVQVHDAQVHRRPRRPPPSTTTPQRRGPAGSTGNIPGR